MNWLSGNWHQLQPNCMYQEWSYPATRFPSNLRQTTCKCVYLWWRSHHSICRSRKRHVPCELCGSVFCRTKFIPYQSFALRERGILCFFLLLWPWLWSDDLHIWTWHVFPEDAPADLKMNFLSLLRSTQPCIPPGSLNRVPASAGVKAGKSPLPGGR